MGARGRLPPSVGGWDDCSCHEGPTHIRVAVATSWRWPTLRRRVVGRAMIAYRAMRAFLRLCARVFFRQVEVVGVEHVPGAGEGPVIFAGNHPNSLLDPLLIVACTDRIVHFAAKDALFKSALLRIFLGSLGAVPIRRRVDQDGATGPANDAPARVDNSVAFDALFDVLASGRCVGIFPEGLSHHESQLARLRTGAARIALGVRGRHPRVPLRIVPCGLTYVHRKRFRSRVLVQFGPPIDVEGSTQASPDRAAVQALTAEIDAGIRALTVNAPDWDTVRVIDAVRRLYQPPRITLEQRAELQRRFLSGYLELREHPAIAALTARVRRYLEALEDYELRDRDLARPLTGRQVAARVLSDAMLLFVWLPLAVPGLLLHAPLGLLVRTAAAALTPRKDVVATTKLLAGLIAVLGAWAALAWLAFGLGGWPWAAAVAALLPLSALATLRVIDRVASLRRLLTRRFRPLRMRAELAALREERDDLEQEVLRAVQRFIPPDLEPLFPRAPDPAPAASTPAEAAP